jgi:hypothetical protein
MKKATTSINALASVSSISEPCQGQGLRMRRYVTIRPANPHYSVRHEGAEDQRMEVPPE